MRAALVLFAVITMSLAASVARAAPPEPQTEQTVQLSEIECVVIWGRFQGQSAVTLESEADEDARASVAKACAFEAIDAKIDAARAASAKTKAPVVEPTWSKKRTTRKLTRAAIDHMIPWITSSEKRPMTADSSAFLRPIRLELREVLAGRDPYGSAAK